MSLDEAKGEIVDVKKSVKVEEFYYQVEIGENYEKS